MRQTHIYRERERHICLRTWVTYTAGVYVSVHTIHIHTQPTKTSTFATFAEWRKTLCEHGKVLRLGCMMCHFEGLSTLKHQSDLTKVLMLEQL